jgi:hypothetical protein
LVHIGNGNDNKRGVAGISSTHADQPDFAGGEPLDVPEAMELLSRMKRQKKTEDLTRSRAPMTGFGWEVAYRAGRQGTGMNGAFQRVTLGTNIYYPDIRERTQ